MIKIQRAINQQNKDEWNNEKEIAVAQKWKQRKK